MKQTVYLLFTFFFSWFCQASILVIEYTKDSKANSTQHGEQVTWVACGQNPQNCDTVYTDFNLSEYESSFYDEFTEKIEKASVVNLSFGFQQKKPVSDYEKEQALTYGSASFVKVIEKREQQINEISYLIESFTKLFDDNPDKLFVIAADNGFELETMVTAGIAINETNFKVYPAILKQTNTLKVAAYDPLSQNLYDYSNYSLDLVDLASVVGTDENNDPIMGTSFAAPLVSEIADNLIEIHNSLSVDEAKEILMKSCHIKNVQAAIKATVDIAKNDKKSEYYKAMHHPISKKRKELRQKFDDVIFVKSGGHLVSELAKSCAYHYVNSSTSMTVELACIKAHKDKQLLSQSDIELLPQLWNLRGF